MIHGHTKESLVAFEERVAAAFEAKQVRGPIHLCSTSQAEPLLRIFEGIADHDFKLGTWRGHWVALLSGVPEQQVFDAICAGRSMFLNFAKQRVICSAIVGGILPIAVGLGMAIHRNPECHCGRGRGPDGSRLSITCPKCDDDPYLDPRQVHVFVGDMAERTGLFHEAVQYVRGHDLPVHFYVEDNHYSTDAPTEELWGRASTPPPITRYTYERDRPHVGTGRRVQFF